MPSVPKVATVLFITIFATIAYLYAENHEHPEVELHSVVIAKQVGPNDWFAVENHRLVLLNYCPDFPNAQFIWVGYKAKTLMYTDFGVCKSQRIRGVWWNRDAQGNAIPASNAEMHEAEKLLAQLEKGESDARQ